MPCTLCVHIQTPTIPDDFGIGILLCRPLKVLQEDLSYVILISFRVNGTASGHNIH